MKDYAIRSNMGMRFRRTAGWLLLLGATACGSSDEAGPSRLEASAIELPGDMFHPEGLALDAAENLYIGSVGTGEILKLARSALSPVRLVAPGSGDLTSAVGLVVDEANDKLWACSADVTFVEPNSLKSFDLSSGAPLESFQLPDGRGICNDLVRDPNGNLYVTDSITGRIHRLPAGGDKLQVWSADPSFAPTTAMEFTVNGADYDVSSNSLYVVKTSTGELFRIPIEASGDASIAQRVTLDRQLQGPDGLRVADANTLFVVEQGALTRVSLSNDHGHGTTSLVVSGLEEPSGLILERSSAWVAEGQIPRLVGFDASSKVLPFRLRRVELR